MTIAPHTLYTVTDDDGDSIMLTNLLDELIIEFGRGGETPGAGVALGPVEALGLAGALVGWVTGTRPVFDVSVSDSEVQR